MDVSGELNLEGARYCIELKLSFVVVNLLADTRNSFLASAILPNAADSFVRRRVVAFVRDMPLCFYPSPVLPGGHEGKYTLNAESPARLEAEEQWV
ncbi:hypothetical protein ACEPAF_1257 [Sanghuangporus sanghuang]